jgi:hypothetical protein
LGLASGFNPTYMAIGSKNPASIIDAWSRITAKMSGSRSTLTLDEKILNCPLHRVVYAQHGHELMRCKSSVGEPTSK